MKVPNQLGNYMNIFSGSRPWHFTLVTSEWLLGVVFIFLFLFFYILADASVIHRIMLDTYYSPDKTDMISAFSDLKWAGR